MQVGRSLRPCWSSSRATGVRCTSGSTPVRSGNGRGRTRPKHAVKSCAGQMWMLVPGRGSFKWQLDSCRGKLEASRVEVKELRRAVKAAQSSKAEVTRFEQRPSESRIEAARQPPVVSLTEVNQLRKALKVAQARAEKAGLLEYEVRELRKDLQGAETHKETIGSQNREIVRLVAELRRLRDQKDAVKSLSGEGYRLRVALYVSEAQKDKLKARLTKLRATGATLSKLSSDEGCSTSYSPEEISAPEGHDHVVRQGERPAAQDRAEVGEAASVAGGSACQTSCNQKGA